MGRFPVARAKVVAAVARRSVIGSRTSYAVNLFMTVDFLFGRFTTILLADIKRRLPFRWVLENICIALFHH